MSKLRTNFERPILHPIKNSTSVLFSRINESSSATLVTFSLSALTNPLISVTHAIDRMRQFKQDPKNDKTFNVKLKNYMKKIISHTMNNMNREKILSTCNWSRLKKNCSMLLQFSYQPEFTFDFLFERPWPCFRFQRPSLD